MEVFALIGGSARATITISIYVPLSLITSGTSASMATMSITVMLLFASPVELILNHNVMLWEIFLGA